MSDTGESGTMSDTGDGSVLSDWSLVDQHGELPDDDTASTTSSVEIVDDDEDDMATNSTPVAGSPSSVTPRFVLRLPSHEHDASDTDEDPVDSPRVSHMLDDHTDAGLFGQLASSNPPAISSMGLDAGKTYNRQSTVMARVSMGELEELRQTLDLLKKNVQPSTIDDNSLSSNQMFGDGRSDYNGVPMKMPTDEQLSHRHVENIGVHGDLLCDDVSMASSVGSSYSFLSKDAGTSCSPLTESIDTADICLTSPDDHQTHLEETASHEFPDDDPLEQPEGDFPMDVGHEENGLNKFILSEFQVQFVVLAGLICYTGLIIQLVLYCCLQGPAFQEKNAFSSCPRYNVELPSSVRDCRDDYSCHHGDDSSDIAEDIEHYNTTRDKEIESLRDEIERLRKEDKDASHTSVQVTFTLINNDLDYSQIKSDISEYKFTNEIKMMLQVKEEQFQWLLKESNEITDKIKNAQKDFVNLTDELVAIKYKKEKTKLSMEMETDPQVHECRGLMDKQVELYSENERLQGMLNESRTRSTDWKLYLENVIRQFERELYDLQLSREQFARDTEQAKGHSEKETDDAQPNTKKEKEDNQSKKRNGKSSGDRKRGENQSTDEEGQSEKEHYSSSNSQNDYYSGRMWADTVLDMMNKTRGQIQDTWATVKNMSESMWTKHKPTVYRLQDAFTRKLQNLSTRFQEKLMRKVNKWFRKDKKHEQQQNNGPNANTKRRKFNVHDHTIKSDVTVESRLVKLSQKVSELNARKFNKWRHEPKIVDIQREFHNVDLITKRGPIMDDEDHWKLTDSHRKWLQCQFQWWKDLDVVMITDDCYQALCCWQVKVTGGDVKQCRKVKRELGIVEDMCTLEHASKYMKHDQEKQRYKTTSDPTIDDGHHETASESDSYSHNTKDEMEEDRHGEALNQFFRHKNNNAKDGKQKSAGVDDEDNWFLDMGEDREYHRGEPDNWFFRRKGKTDSEDGTKSRFTRPDIDLDDSDFEDEDYYGNWYL